MGEFTVGYKTYYGYISPGGNRIKYGTFSMPQLGIPLRGYIKTYLANGAKFKVAIYNASNQFLAVSDEGTVTGGGVVTSGPAYFTGQPAIDPGTIKLAHNMDLGRYGIGPAGGGGHQWYAYAYSGWPATLAAGANISARLIVWVVFDEVFESSAELSCTFFVSSSEALLAKFQVGQDSVDLLSRFEVGQGTENLYAQFEVGQGLAELLGNAVIRHTGTVELLANAVVRHVGTPIKLLSKTIVRHVGIPVELLGRGDVQQSSSAELLGGFEVGQGSAELLGEFIVCHDTFANLLGEFVVRHVGIPVELLGKAIIRHVGTPLEVLGKFVTRHSDHAEFLSKFEVGQDSADLLSHLEVGQDSIGLTARFEVGQGAEELLGKAAIRHPASSNLKFSLYVSPWYLNAAEMLIGGLDREIVVGGRDRRMKIK